MPLAINYSQMASDIAKRIQQRLDELGLSARAASLRATGSDGTIRMILSGKTANPRSDTLAKLAPVLETSVEWLMGETARLPSGSEIRPANVPLPARDAMPRDVPVFGTVAGSELGKGAFQLTTDVVEYVRRPPGLATVKDAYALYVEGESMSPKFEPGELVYVHPHRKVVSGDYVVIQEPDGDHGEPRGFIKQYLRQTAKLLQTQQFNPASKVDFVIRPGLKWHRVMSLSDLMGF